MRMEAILALGKSHREKGCQGEVISWRRYSPRLALAAVSRDLQAVSEFRLAVGMLLD